ncbi:hypothetical protein DSL72_003788 [Monilinia vaccinii-corymbosi]|uniref:2EXR domain-containing protein n=1 Tax=Monilinia vaccinii-corymbosi TaxID=61207 RepID=A0A8A3P286_9HELO|nr:hypothetical protein DSL72_003788 [Monilinia vaccinii-corymbosi]
MSDSDRNIFLFKKRPFSSLEPNHSRKHISHAHILYKILNTLYNRYIQHTNDITYSVSSATRETYNIPQTNRNSNTTRRTDLAISLSQLPHYNMQTRSMTKALQEATLLHANIQEKVEMVTDHSSDSDCEEVSRQADTSRALVANTKVQTLFKDFSRLPAEIRLMIWGFSFPEPRKVVTTSEGVEGLYVSPSITLLRPPITCFINMESRAETLKLWKVFGQSSFRPNYDDFQIDFESWDNPEYVKSMEVFELNCPGCFSKIEEVTLVAKRWRYGFDAIYPDGYVKSEMPHMFQHLPMLKRVLLLCPEWENRSIPDATITESRKWFQGMWKDTWGDQTIPELLYTTSRTNDMPETRINLFKKQTGSFRRYNQ